jgi:hypothetical protein
MCWQVWPSSRHGHPDSWAIMWPYILHDKSDCKMELHLSSVSPPVSTLGIWNLCCDQSSVYAFHLSLLNYCVLPRSKQDLTSSTLLHVWIRERKVKAPKRCDGWLLWNTCSGPKLTLTERRKEWMVATVLLSLSSIMISPHASITGSSRVNGWHLLETSHSSSHRQR